MQPDCHSMRVPSECRKGRCRVGDIAIQKNMHATSCRRLISLSLGLLVTACSSSTSADQAAPTTSPIASEAAATTSPAPSEQPKAFPVPAFTDISADPVSEERAEEFQQALKETSDRLGGAGISATVLSPAGTWSGSEGPADSRRPVGIGDQFAIASVTKTLQAGGHPTAHPAAVPGPAARARPEPTSHRTATQRAS